MQQLRDHRIRNTGIQCGAEVHDAFAEQMRIDVDDAFAARITGDDIGNGVRTHRAISIPNDTRRAGMT